jgi:hypothetical protein
MKTFKIEKSNRGPEVILDTEKGVFAMKYDSRPENVRKFYYPIIEALNLGLSELIDNGKVDSFKENAFLFSFKLGYFNSSSAKFILDIMNIARNFYEKGLNIKVEWYYQDDDEDMKEAGEDFADFCEMEFSFIETDEDF